ncbi:hypothetical protein AB0G71_22815 [Streptomyces sp. NPDC020403]|uniref:hypothetical protein n=1 Tax=unclassified Streptomyces TaxID=2593676 RepID=UPI0033F4C0AA
MILGSVGIDLRSWFLERSEPSETQVTDGGLGSLAHEVVPARLPVHPGTRPDLLASADYAYRHLTPSGFNVDLSALQAAHDFAALYDRNGVSQCGILDIDAYQAPVAAFAPLAAWELLGWPPVAEIDPAGETWQLGIEAMREFQRLSLYGPVGLAASGRPPPKASSGSSGRWRTTPCRSMWPPSTPTVNGQDHEILREALARGEAEGAQMPALRALIAQLPA